MDLALIFLVILTLLQVGDAWTTINILEMKGGRELNPIMRFLFDKFGIIHSLILSKTLVVVAFWYANIWWATALMCIVYIGVVWHNWRQMTK